MNINHPPNPFVGTCGFASPKEAREIADEARSGHPVMFNLPVDMKTGADALPTDPAQIFPGEEEAHGLNCVRLRSWPGGKLLASLKEIEQTLAGHLDAILIDANEWPCEDGLRKPEAQVRRPRMLILRVSQKMMACANGTAEAVAERIARYAAEIDHVLVEHGDDATGILAAIRLHPRLAHVGIGVSGSATRLLGADERATIARMVQRFHGHLSVDIVPETGDETSPDIARAQVRQIYEIFRDAKKSASHPQNGKLQAVA
jgi:hypothetical protein